MKCHSCNIDDNEIILRLYFQSKVGAKYQCHMDRLFKRAFVRYHGFNKSNAGEFSVSVQLDPTFAVMPERSNITIEFPHLATHGIFLVKVLLFEGEAINWSGAKPVHEPYECGMYHSQKTKQCNL